MADRRSKKIVGETVFAMAGMENKAEPTPPFLYTPQDLALMTEIKRV